MKPILFKRDDTTFTSNGLGRLSEAVSCIVEEERNGKYELELTYPITGAHYSEIDTGSIICARHSDANDIQPFRVYKITRPLNGIVTIYARHLSYDLNKITVAPFSDSSLTQLFLNLPSHAVNNCPFSFTTDKTVATSFSVSVPSSIRSLLGGSEGSILDIYGGEYEFDGYTVKLWASRGTNNGVTIRYAKNLTELKQDADDTNTVTSVLPYWSGTDSDGNETIVSTPSAVVSSVGYLEPYNNEQNEIYTDGDEVYNGVLYPSLCIPLDLSEAFQTAPTEAQLITAAQTWLTNHATLTPNINLTVSFVQLWQTNEYASYAPLQRVKLCDTVTVIYPKLGVSATAKVIRVKYNTLLERYDEIEIGDAKSTLAETIVSAEKAIQTVEEEKPSTSFMQAAIDKATALIAGGYGGYVVITRNADGEPTEILIMDTDDAATATNIIRMNMNGIGFSTDGGSTYSTAWTIDGHFNANYITAGTLQSIMIAGPKVNGNIVTFWDLATGIFQNYGSSTVEADVETSEGVYTPTSYTVNHKTIIQNGNLEVDASANGGTETQYMKLGIAAEGMNYEFYEDIVGTDRSDSYPYAGLNLYGDTVTGLGGVHYQYDGVEMTYKPAGTLTPDYLILGGAADASRNGYYPDRNNLRLQSGWGNYENSIVHTSYYTWALTPNGTKRQFHDAIKRRPCWEYAVEDQLYIDSTTIPRIVAAGYLTDERKTIWCQIPLLRPVSPDVVFLDIYADMKARVNGTYIIGGSGTKGALAYEDEAYTYKAYWSDAGLTLKITKSNNGTFSSSYNNYPVALDFYDLDILFFDSDPYA